MRLSNPNPGGGGPTGDTIDQQARAQIAVQELRQAAFEAEAYARPWSSSRAQQTPALWTPGRRCTFAGRTWQLSAGRSNSTAARASDAPDLDDGSVAAESWIDVADIRGRILFVFPTTAARNAWAGASTGTIATTTDNGTWARYAAGGWRAASRRDVLLRTSVARGQVPIAAAASHLRLRAADGLPELEYIDGLGEVISP